MIYGGWDSLDLDDGKRVIMIKMTMSRMAMVVKKLV